MDGAVSAPLPAAEGAETEAAWAAVITAAGSSARMGAEGKKEYRCLPGRVDRDGKPLTVLGAAAAAFAAITDIKTIGITVPPAAAAGEMAARGALPSRFFAGRSRGGLPRLLFVPGGGTRRVSVHHALSYLEVYRPRYVLIHDGARPWVDAALIRSVMAAVIRYGAALPVVPLVETPKEIVPAAELPEAGLPGDAGVFFVKRHLRRSRTGAAQTPQGFAFPAILRAHEQAAERELADGFEYTDDAEIWGEFCGPAAVVPGSPENRKITFPGDLEH
jgi:2-C-methyl-D-erythritol 4-phosphate cytidylyltransferase